MKQWILASIVLVMALGLGACSSDDESKSNTVDEYGELPAWLVPQVKALENEFKDFRGTPSLCYSISRAAGIHGETVFALQNTSEFSLSLRKISLSLRYKY